MAAAASPRPRQWMTQRPPVEQSRSVQTSSCSSALICLGIENAEVTATPAFFGTRRWRLPKLRMQRPDRLQSFSAILTLQSLRYSERSCASGRKDITESVFAAFSREETAQGDWSVSHSRLYDWLLAKTFFPHSCGVVSTGIRSDRVRISVVRHSPLASRNSFSDDLFFTWSETNCQPQAAPTPPVGT